MFTTDGPLDPESPLFVGRQAELRALEQTLTGASGICGVLGAHQTGRTSLLLQLRKRCQAKYEVVYVNAEIIGRVSLGEWYQALAQELVVQLDLEPARSPTSTVEFIGFLRFLARTRASVRILVLLDSLGSLGPETANQFGHCLRAIATERQVQPELRRFGFVFSGGDETLELAAGRNSPLRNVTQNVYLTDLSNGDTALLIRRGLGQMDDALVEQVYAWTNGHPYLTQLVGSLLLDAPSPISAATVAESIERVIRLDDRHLPPLWDALSDQRRPKLRETVITVLRESRKQFTRSDPTVARLELIGVISDRDGFCDIRNRVYRTALQRWVQGADSLTSLVRLPEVERAIAEELMLLAQYEERLREEHDPRERLRIDNEIKRIKRTLADAEQEHASLQSEAANARALSNG